MQFVIETRFTVMNVKTLANTSLHDVTHHG